MEIESQQGQSTSKVLVIGLDGATFGLLKPLATKGLLPNLSHIMAAQFSGVLQSTVPPITAAAWTTFITGKNPGKHGILQFVDIRPASSQVRQEGTEVFPGGFTVLNSRSIREQTLWQIISEAGQRLVVINVPMTYPPAPLNGVMIADMLTPPGAKDFTYPIALAERLPGYEIDLALHEREFHYPPDAFLERLFTVTEKRCRACLQLMREEPWDFFMVVFTGTDRIQHRFWRYLDENDPAYYDAEAKRLRPRLEAYYHRLDAMIGELRQQAGTEVATFILSDHGFGPMATHNVYKSVLLRELGLAHGPANWAVLVRAALERVGLTRARAYRLFGKILPQRWLANAIKGLRASEQRTWQKQAAFIPTLHSYIGGLTFNREVIETRGESQASLRETMKAKLQDLTDPMTGARIVTRVAEREELYHGARLQECPDLIFFLDPRYMLVGGRGRSGRLVEPKQDEPERQGSHRAEGILLISAPMIRKAATAGDIGLADVSVTLLYTLGIPIPADMDGRVIVEAFAPDYLEDHPIIHGEPREDAQAAVNVGALWESERDAEAIRSRLRGLGYIE